MSYQSLYRVGSECLAQWLNSLLSTASHLVPKPLWKCELQYILYYKMAKCLLSSLFLNILCRQGKEFLMSLFGKGKSPGRFSKNTLEKPRIIKNMNFYPFDVVFPALELGNAAGSTSYPLSPYSSSRIQMLFQVI